MEKKKQRPSLILGLAGFSSYALVMATIPDFAIPGAAFALLIAVAAGAAQAHADRFFAGVTLAFGY